jgi:hypothetical protein
MATPSVSRVNGTGYNAVSIPNKSQSQMGLFNQGAQGLQQGFPQILQQLMQMAQGGDEAMWNQFEAPAKRQFNEQMGQIASRFSGMGMGGRRSSGHFNVQSGAAADLAERLQANRLGLQQNAQSRLMELYQNLLAQDLTSTAFLPKQKNWFQELMGGLGMAGSQALGNFGGMGLNNLAGLGR